MFESQFTSFFNHLRAAQQGVIFHQEGELITQHHSPHHPPLDTLNFKHIFREIEQTFPLIGEFKEGSFESEDSIWLVYPLSSSLKLAIALQREVVLNQARFWSRELISQINQSL